MNNLKRMHTLGYFSSYDRGLEWLLAMWPKIKEKYPDAELHVCYGWNTFLSAFSDNPERMSWKAKIEKLMMQSGITHHGRIGKEELKKVREQCGIWAYSTDFAEINCITALECQNDGCVPCVINYAALKETVQSGVKVSCEIADKECQEEYLKELLALMGDEKRQEEERAKGKEFAQQFQWQLISKEWNNVIEA